ncbi:FAD-dependent oxidoreductase [Trinickia caryophylli]|uniref:Reductase C-terminal n=1 Tax=Trinickia caryophylli TaxID=28094 RepID=A0A1X7HBI8_TRICW|nr:FAD-dependent oxidoreductase [Trinickia caryophylli]PMS08955.1 pyridine nucleotide-disulfide oxidoreductase [Trinickia caryophylli]TRX17506.1 pyridine nucleotide-disulfide oxidoreductase [Trinickia caryophylli]WQE11746.1 FAD-dependent oxidoreductase [Trinickia caryophylli]SMF82412.1 Reductase C-terminal [Trinickia caryophylli]GLU35819.1 pyridine nucleotide-disulfide oxidoreductase [Trinickia caryophylli]
MTGREPLFAKSPEFPNDPQEVDYLLIGGGIAGATAAHTLRSEGAQGRILMLCAENVAPYNRPALVRRFLGAGLEPQGFACYPASSYASNNIELRLGCKVERIVPADRLVEIEQGPALHYRKLLIATGSEPRRLDVPNAALAGIHSLHDVADAATLRRSAKTARRAVIVGASFVGLEAAEWLVGLGIEVTMLESANGAFPALRAQQLSDLFYERCAARGVTIRLETSVARFDGDERVERVVTTAGDAVECDLVLIAIGVTPRMGLVRDSGIETGDGIVVDAFLQTSVPDVFAAGDVARFEDNVLGMQRRIEHWDNAVRQGRIAAKNMLGQRMPYREVSMYYGDIFGVGFNLLGADDDASEVVARGRFGGESYALLYVKGDALRGCFSVARPAEETHAAEMLIRYRTSLAPYRARLADPDFELASIPSQTVLILQGGGALGAFECGVVRALEEHDVVPDVVSAVSIGAFNGAIIASHPGAATQALSAFWRELTIHLPRMPAQVYTDALLASYVLCFGVPNFCVPRWVRMPLSPLAYLGWSSSLYDTGPAIELIERYVDFARLKTSPIRLLVSAVDVSSGELKIFDSYVDELTPQHLLASGSLPPSFPWTCVDGHAYWDGGIVSNSPLDLVVERCGSMGRHAYIVDLFSGPRPLPSNLLAAVMRRDEIVYTDRVRNDMRVKEYADDATAFVAELVRLLGEDEARKLRQHPLYVRLMAGASPTRITRIALDNGKVGPAFTKDYDFSDATVRRLQDEGYRTALAALGAGGAKAREAAGAPMAEVSASAGR